MLLQYTKTKTLVEVLDAQELINPLKDKIFGKIQSGQEEQEPEEFNKNDLIFPSGENLPRCWLDADYQTEN